MLERQPDWAVGEVPWGWWGRCSCMVEMHSRLRCAARQLRSAQHTRAVAASAAAHLPATRAPGRPRCRRGLHGRKLEAGFSGRQDLLLFGEAAERQGADQLSGQDMWIGLDTSAGGGGGGAAAGGAS